MKKLTKKQVKEYIKMEIRLFEMDFTDTKYGKRAKLLHHHYQLILDLINRME